MRIYFYQTEVCRSVEMRLYMNNHKVQTAGNTEGQEGQKKAWPGLEQDSLTDETKTTWTRMTGKERVEKKRNVSWSEANYITCQTKWRQCDTQTWTPANENRSLVFIDVLFCLLRTPSASAQRISDSSWGLHDFHVTTHKQITIQEYRYTLSDISQYNDSKMMMWLLMEVTGWIVTTWSNQTCLIGWIISKYILQCRSNLKHCSSLN